jgi:peptidoglycan/LPS O-acetylase OafA/YrhL
MAFLYAQTFCYVRERQGVRLGDRLLTWLVLTPALYLFQVIVVGPAMIAALLNLRHRSWQTRNDTNAAATSVAIRTGRSRYLDTLRTLAIVRVVAFHGTGVAWLGMVFPSMGVMFALAGSLMASSMAKAGDRPEIVIWSRFKRLMPAVWALAAVLIPVMMIMGWGPNDVRPLNAPAIYAWVFPLSDPPSNAWAVPIAGILWYIRTYLWLVIISPLLWAGFRRWPMLTTALPVVLLPISANIHFSAWLSDVLAQLGTYAPCWILGFWHATGKLRALGRKTLLIGALCIAAAIGWMQIQPLPQGFIQSDPVAQLLWSAAFVVVLLRFEPAMRFMDRVKPLARLVRAVNARAVTIYLWHQLAILTAVAVIARARLGRIDNHAALLCVKFALVAALIVLICWLMGWVEDLTAPKQRSRATGGRHQAEVMAALHPAPDTDQTVIIPRLPTQTPRSRHVARHPVATASHGRELR